ncbi:MAG: ATP-binding protein [Chloroflexi bacterium]|nr:ATP-binding protein [Chloroflexota bacterium]
MPRVIFPEILKWLPEKEIIVISGARQTGKTTLLHKLQEQLPGRDVIYVNFERPSQLENFILSPLDFVSLHLSESGITYFLFDEFQHVPNAGKILKLLYDEFAGRAKFVITGSSSLAIREIAGFLVGRAVFFNLYPFSFGEYLLAKQETLHRLWEEKRAIWDAFLSDKTRFQVEEQADWVFRGEMERRFEEYLIYGGYPAVVLSRPELKTKRLDALVDTYVEKDVVQFLRAGYALEFKQLARLLALQLGNLVNFSSLQNDANLSYREVRRFVGLLETTFVIKLLKPYAANPTSEIKKSPKVYFVDAGLRNSLVADFRPLMMRPDRGGVVENGVFLQLLLQFKEESLRFWRKKLGAEVDFLLVSPRQQLFPIEVKYQLMKRPAISPSFASFLKTYHPRRGVVLNRNLFAISRFVETDVLFLPVFFV